MSDLALATIQELADELKRRTDALIIAYTNPGKVHGDPGVFQTLIHGNSTTCSGLARAVTIRLDKELTIDEPDGTGA